MLRHAAPVSFTVFKQGAVGQRGRMGAGGGVSMKGGGGGGGGGKSKGNTKGRAKKANPDLAKALEKWEPVIGIEIHAQLSSNTKV